jgi:hypothetical protein
MIIKVTNDFTDTPGARYKNQGPYSGEEFRNRILYPKFIEAENSNEDLTVDLDGGYGYGSSFLEESFGGLVRKLSEEKFDRIDDVKKIKIVSHDNPVWIEKVAKYIDEAIVNLKKGRK